MKKGRPRGVDFVARGKASLGENHRGPRADIGAVAPRRRPLSLNLQTRARGRDARVSGPAVRSGIGEDRRSLARAASARNFERTARDSHPGDVYPLVRQT